LHLMWFIVNVNALPKKTKKKLLKHSWLILGYDWLPDVDNCNSICARDAFDRSGVRTCLLWL